MSPPIMPFTMQRMAMGPEMFSPYSAICYYFKYRLLKSFGSCRSNRITGVVVVEKYGDHSDVALSDFD